MLGMFCGFVTEFISGWERECLALVCNGWDSRDFRGRVRFEFALTGSRQSGSEKPLNANRKKFRKGQEASFVVCLA